MEHSKISLAFFILLVTSCTSRDTSSQHTGEADSLAFRESSDTKIHVVTIEQMKFSPDTIRVKKGDRVQWINKDFTDHDVTEASTKAWFSSRLKPGQSWSLVVTEGADYYCDIHQVMKGTVLVE